MSQAFAVADRTLCTGCANKFSAENRLGPGQIGQMSDPTVCRYCGADAGEEEWPHVAQLPACTSCEAGFRNRPYPDWLKLSFTIFLAVAVAAFAYNLRFFRAYVEIIRGNHSMEDGKIEQAIANYSLAAEWLPEIPELATVPNLYKSQLLVNDEKYSEALALVQKSRAHAAPSYRSAFNEVEIGAQIGLAFDRHDYDAFVEQARQLVTMNPDDAYAHCKLASAYACKYASTGAQEFHKDAMHELALAKANKGAELPQFTEYESRVVHRLHSREIITREEFKKRFPNGWKPEGGA